jgi:hypothetical protein
MGGPVKVLVCGSRTWWDPERLRARLAELPEHAEIIQGGAGGADKLAAEFAADHALPCRTFPADWQRHGKRAGILRNLRMLDEEPDLVIAFWDGESKGTAHTIGEARRRGVPVEIVGGVAR